MKFIKRKLYKSIGELDGKITNEFWILKLLWFEIVLKEKVYFLN